MLPITATYSNDSIPRVEGYGGLPIEGIQPLSVVLLGWNLLDQVQQPAQIMENGNLTSVG